MNINIDDILPAKVNDAIYRPIDPWSPDILKLAEDIQANGILEPLVLTRDRVILSGHRRYAAAKIAGLKSVPCRIDDDISSCSDQFEKRLVSFNTQRVKGIDEVLREAVVRDSDGPEAYYSVLEHRKQNSETATSLSFEIEGEKKRHKISENKYPLLNAIVDVFNKNRSYWPLSVRQVHYYLLNDPPLKHAKKPDSIYRNDKKGYDATVDILVRARLEGIIPFHCVTDKTRPFEENSFFMNNQEFIDEQISGMLKGYSRNLLQSQPNHIEVVGEKLTIKGVIGKVCSDYCVPFSIGRGFTSLTPRYEMAERFKKSGKENLVVLLLSDFDPDGQEIAQSFARSMRDDFGIESILPIMVAITPDQVEKYNLPKNLEAKKSSSNYKKFVSAHGKNAWELEALQPEALEQILVETINTVIDQDLFKQEVEKEKDDAAGIYNYRKALIEMIRPS